MEEKLVIIDKYNTMCLHNNRWLIIKKVNNKVYLSDSYFKAHDLLEKFSKEELKFKQSKK